MTDYFRPLVQSGPRRPEAALPLAGGPLWFTEVEHITRSDPRGRILPASELPGDVRRDLTGARPDVAGLSMSAPRIMGILNVTPDSFSDGGQHKVPALAAAHAGRMIEAGADIIDIGGESTRPGAETIPTETEIARVLPAVQAIRSAHPRIPISIDTRKSTVAHAAHVSQPRGIDLINDVSGFTFDRGLSEFAARMDLPVCVMHARGDPETMHLDPRYDDVLLDVYDFLAGQIALLVGAGIPRERIVADPGIGFGKTITHNLAILQNMSLFHALGVPVLLGASRKGFIGRITGETVAERRVAGSVAVALSAVAQGVQIVRVHDVAETRQALDLWQAVTAGEWHGSGA